MLTRFVCSVLVPEGESIGGVQPNLLGSPRTHFGSLDLDSHLTVSQFAVACGLHQITIDTLKDPMGGNLAKRQLTYTPWNSHVTVQGLIAPGVLEPPQDGIELGERIYTWWGVYLLDKNGSITLGLASALPDETHPTNAPTTSWPRLLDEYARVRSIPSLVPKPDVDSPRVTCH